MKSSMWLKRGELMDEKVTVEVSMWPKGWAEGWKGHGGSFNVTKGRSWGMKRSRWRFQCDQREELRDEKVTLEVSMWPKGGADGWKGHGGSLNVTKGRSWGMKRLRWKSQCDQRGEQGNEKVIMMVHGAKNKPQSPKWIIQKRCFPVFSILLEVKLKTSNKVYKNVKKVLYIKYSMC